MNCVFKSFLKVTHTASFITLSVQTVYVTLVRSRVDIHSKITNVYFPVVFRTCLLVSSRVSLKILQMLSEIRECNSYVLA
jgi:hypothetical protein